MRCIVRRTQTSIYLACQNEYMWETEYACHSFIHPYVTVIINCFYLRTAFISHRYYLFRNEYYAICYFNLSFVAFYNLIQNSLLMRLHWRGGNAVWSIWLSRQTENYCTYSRPNVISNMVWALALSSKFINTIAPLAVARTASSPVSVYIGQSDRSSHENCQNKYETSEQQIK